jgi:hypothetical protein
LALLNLNHLKMVLSAIDNRLKEATDEQIIAWLNEESVVTPTASASGAIYTTNKNEIYIL